jgi:hypothetical protein
VNLHRRVGTILAAAAAYSRAATLFGDLGDGYYQAAALRSLGRSQQAAGDLTAARSAGRAALAVLEQLHHPEAADLRAELAGGTPWRRSAVRINRSTPTGRRTDDLGAGSTVAWPPTRVRQATAHSIPDGRCSSADVSADWAH